MVKIEAPERQLRALHLELMLRFRTPIPGVRVRAIKVVGYSDDEVINCFRRLQRQQIVHVRLCVDASGKPYVGQLVGLSALGSALLASVLREESMLVEETAARCKTE